MIKEISDFFKEVFTNYLNDNAFRKGAALAFYTVFSIVPILIIIISLAGLFFGEQAVTGEIQKELSTTLGQEAATQVQELIKNRHIQGSHWTSIIVGIITLIFGATGVFNELQTSLNDVWDIKAKPQNGILAYVSTRILSFGMILVIGFLLLLSITLNSFLHAFAEQISTYTSKAILNYSFVGEFIVSLAMISFLFALIFKYLPDVDLHWKPALVGGLFTAVLFAIGKFLISLYLGKSSLMSFFGSAGAIAVLLMWVYYASQILFLGAEFTHVWAEHNGKAIRPNKNAVKISYQEVKH
jgi:membrane protein